jgi:hypothetical protein
VADENQVGLEEFRVFAYAAGKRRRLVAAAETDDRGIYRLRGLQPGRYLVRTAARRIEGGQGLLPTWYGQTVSIAGARAVEVELDGEAAGVDITPAPGQPGTLSGRIAGGSASQVVLAGETGPRAAKVDGGRFDFGPVEPGRYALVVDPAAAGGQAAAYQEVNIAEGAANVVLELKRAPILTVACGGARGEQIDPRGVSVFLKRKELDEDPQRALCGETSVRGPGTWEIAAAPPPQYYVASFTEAAGGDEVFEFLLQPGESRRVDVALGTDPASLSGTVRTPDGEPAIGAPVFLAAQDADLERRLGGVKATRADGAGSFRFAGLAPGRYEAVASYQVREPAAENWPRGRGEVVVLENGRERKQDLRVIVLE